MRQIMFRDFDGVARGGILLDNGDILCGCCGGIFTSDEIGEFIEIVEVYDDWIDISDEIIGR